MALLDMFTRLEGHDGYVVVKGLGGRPGEVSRWTITRHGDESPRKGELDLYAVFSFVVPGVLLDPDYAEGRELVCKVSKSRAVRVKLDDSERMALTGKVLEMKGIKATWEQE